MNRLISLQKFQTVIAAVALCAGVSAYAQQCPIKQPIDPNASTVAPINTADRQAVTAAYNAIYVPTLATPIGWTGNTATCNAGDTSAAYKTAVVRMFNYHRAMAGLPGSVTLNTTFSANAQQAALMMHANNALNHTPPNTWLCYTATGANAAGSSNLGLSSGTLGISVFPLYMNDINIPSLGHRRWILAAGQTQIGTGDTSNANALWVFGPSGTLPPTPNGIPWPPAGFVPYALAPANMTWSFSMPGANFSSASVTVRNAQNQVVPVTVSQPGNGYGDNAIAFAATGGSWPYAAPGDSVFDVTVSNVNVSGATRNFSYRVTLITP